MPRSPSLIRRRRGSRRGAADWLQIALLAMLLQVLTPVLALNSMAAAAAAGGLPATPLCSSAADGPAAHQAMRHDSHPSHEASCLACPFCSAVHVALPAAMPAPTLPSIQGHVAHPTDLTASPRGPPLLRPNARAPPTLS